MSSLSIALYYENRDLGDEMTRDPFAWFSQPNAVTVTRTAEPSNPTVAVRIEGGSEVWSDALNAAAKVP